MSNDAMETMKGKPVNKLTGAYRAWGYVKVAGALVSGLAIFGMMCFIIADVFSRNFLGGSISGSFEIAQNYFMPLSVFPALAYVYGSGFLPKMDLLVHKVPRPVQATVTYALLVLELVIFTLLVYYTWEYAVDGMQRSVAFPAGGSLYTLWPLYFFVPVGFAMILVETLFVLVNNITGGFVSLAMGGHEPEGL